MEESARFDLRAIPESLPKRRVALTQLIGKGKYCARSTTQRKCAPYTKSFCPKLFGGLLTKRAGGKLKRTMLELCVREEQRVGSLGKYFN